MLHALSFIDQLSEALERRWRTALGTFPSSCLSVCSCFAAVFPAAADVFTGVETFAVLALAFGIAFFHGTHRLHHRAVVDLPVLCRMPDAA